MGGGGGRWGQRPVTAQEEITFWSLIIQWDWVKAVWGSGAAKVFCCATSHSFWYLFVLFHSLSPTATLSRVLFSRLLVIEGGGLAANKLTVRRRLHWCKGCVCRDINTGVTSSWSRTALNTFFFFFFFSPPNLCLSSGSPLLLLAWYVIQHTDAHRDVQAGWWLQAWHCHRRGG